MVASDLRGTPAAVNCPYRSLNENVPCVLVARDDVPLLVELALNVHRLSVVPGRWLQS